MRYLLGYDLGSSSVKTALLDVNSGEPPARAFSPAFEMRIHSPSPGFAEPDPEQWWQELIQATHLLRRNFPFKQDEIIAIGVCYPFGNGSERILENRNFGGQSREFQPSQQKCNV